MARRSAAINVIIGGILLHLSLGSMFVWGCIQPYVTSYIRLYHASATMQDTSTVYVFAFMGQATTAPLVGPIQSRLGFRGCAMVGAAVVVLSTLGCSRAKTVAELSVLYTMLGVGIATGYTCPLVCGYAWMPDRMGMVSGFVLAGFGASAAVLDLVAMVVVNPGNASPDPETGYYGKEIADRVPLMFVVLGTCCLFMGMVGSSMISLPPQGSISQGTADVYSKLASVGTNNNYESVTVAGGTSAYFEKNVLQDCCEDGAKPQEQGNPPQRHIIGTDRGESVEAGAMAEEGQACHTDLAARTVASVSSCSSPPLPPPPEMQGSGQAHANIGSPAKSAIEHGTDSCARSQGGALVNGSGGGEVTPQRQFEVWELLGERDFYHLLLCMMLTSVSGLYILGCYKRIGEQSFPNGDRFLSILGSFASLCNASGRIVSGLTVDRIGCFPTLIMLSVTMTSVLLSLALVEASRPYFFFAICFLHMLFGSNIAIYPTLIADCFGAATAGPNCGLLSMGFGLSSFVAVVGLARINNSSQVLLACAGVSLMGASSVALLWKRRWRRGLMTHQDW